MSKRTFHRPDFSQLQRLGKSLMLPIALLPAAGILLRLGQDDLLGRIQTPVIGPFFEAMSAAGQALFSQLPLLFAVGVAIGFAKKADGSTALAAVAGYLVMGAVFKQMSPLVLNGVKDSAGDQALIDYSVFGGIVVGLLTAWLYDKYHDIKLPSYLGFFGGRRFVPIVVSVTTLITGFVLSYIYPIFNEGLTAIGRFIGGTGALGAFVYGFANRMLIPVGLHHILNTYVWFIYGDYNGPDGTVSGELSRFAAGDHSAGLLTSGFYPILMFGLPAAALAMIHTAKKGQKATAIGILSAAGLTAFFTGVTEPLEFAFMFLAFPLYVVHAVLTGLSLAIAELLNIHLGFSFSAGLLDLILYGTAPAAHNIPLLIVQGLAFAVLYYVIFRFAIVHWNLHTPGRADATVGTAGNTDQSGSDTGTTTSNNAPSKGTPAKTGSTAPQGSATPSSRAEALINAFGGRDNLANVDACITRLRMEVNNPAAVDKNKLQALGASGVMEIGTSVQAVFGTESDVLKDEINAALAVAGTAQRLGPTSDAAMPEQAATSDATDDAVGDAPTPGANTGGSTGSHPAESHGPLQVRAPIPGTVIPLSQVDDETFASETVGRGLAIRPEDGVLETVAPVSGRIMQLFPHAFAIMTDDRIGVLVHLGIDTVELNGQGFTVHAAKGDHVVQGQPIVTYDVPAVAAASRPTTVPVVVMDSRRMEITMASDPTENASVTTMRPLFTVEKPTPRD
ncbi:glucose PTS transporter subunit IIA [Corynebacterium kroppenstedtii]|nr:glucose PTS transporter subunit IIA [Corynebacterium kroppenstedtii]